VFEFTLRPGAKFSDGTPVTADAAVAWLRYFVKAKGIFSNVLGPEPKFTATGPLSVRVELKLPNPSLPLILSDQGSVIGRIGSPKAAANPKLMDSGTYGAGPYMLQASSTVNGDHYTYVPNPYYWDKKAVHFKSIYLKVIANASTRLQAQQSGQYDVTIGDPATAAAAKKAGLEVATAPQGHFYLSLDLKHNVGAPALKDVRVRQAMNYAIDRAGIAKALFGESSGPAYGFITQDNDTTSSNFKYDYDPAKAKQLMAAAGYSKGFTLSSIDTGTFFGKFGTPLMNAVAQNFQAIGIKLESKSYPNLSAYATQVFKFKSAVDQSLGVITTTPAAYTQNVDPAAPVNFYGNDPEIARDYRQAVTSTDPKAGWDKVWQRYTKQAYTVPLVMYPALYYVSKKIGGVEVSAKHPSALPTEWYPAS
jgi:peptide/nickel transport system substrate-binding protein